MLFFFISAAASLQAARREREKIIAESMERVPTSLTKGGRSRQRAVADIPPHSRPNLQAWTGRSGRSGEGGKVFAVSFEEPLPTHLRSEEGLGVESMVSGLLLDGPARSKSAGASIFTLPLKVCVISTEEGP